MNISIIFQSAIKSYGLCYINSLVQFGSILMHIFFLNQTKNIINTCFICIMMKSSCELIVEKLWNLQLLWLVGCYYVIGDCLFLFSFIAFPRILMHCLESEPMIICICWINLNPKTFRLTNWSSMEQKDCNQELNMNKVSRTWTPQRNIFHCAIL